MLNRFLGCMNTCYDWMILCRKWFAAESASLERERRIAGAITFGTSYCLGAQHCVGGFAILADRQTWPPIVRFVRDPRH
ncbi:MAG: hypothetical protein ACR2N1_05475 [Rubripirellula sp.]